MSAQLAAERDRWQARHRAAQREIAELRDQLTRVLALYHELERLSRIDPWCRELARYLADESQPEARREVVRQLLGLALALAREEPPR